MFRVLPQSHAVLVIGLAACCEDVALPFRRSDVLGLGYALFGSGEFQRRAA